MRIFRMKYQRLRVSEIVYGLLLSIEIAIAVFFGSVILFLLFKLRRKPKQVLPDSMMGS